MSKQLLLKQLKKSNCNRLLPAVCIDPSINFWNSDESHWTPVEEAVHSWPLKTVLRKINIICEGSPNKRELPLVGKYSHNVHNELMITEYDGSIIKIWRSHISGPVLEIYASLDGLDGLFKLLFSDVRLFREISHWSQITKSWWFYEYIIEKPFCNLNRSKH